MSAHVVVIATDLRRTTVKVTPATYLTDVLQKACNKLNLPGDKYLMKHNQKQVDLSIPFRTSGLTPGAKLELVQKSKTPSAVKVGLQYFDPESKDSPSQRLSQHFPSDLTLWKILRQFESGNASGGRNINITARGVAKLPNNIRSGGGQLYYEKPVLNIMGREFSTFVDFQKTLSQLGYNSGSVLIRLEYRLSDQTLYGAMEEISQLFKEVEEEQRAETTAVDEKAPEPSAPQQDPDTLMADAQREPTGDAESQPSVYAPQGQQTDHGATAATEHSDILGERDPYKPVNVFLAPSSTTPAAALAPRNETDYTPTVAHAQLHQARLQEHSKNKRLLSDKELEEKAAAEEAKIAAVKSVLVKVRFPDNTSSEWQIGPSETGAFLYEAVRHVMANSDQPFRLTLPGGKSVIKDDSSPKHSLIKAYKFSGRVLVNLAWDEGVSPDARKQSFLKANVARQGQAVKVPEVPQVADKEEAAPVLPEPKEEKSSGDGVGKKVPKWFKLGKK